MGRPSIKTPEIVAAICERLAEGEPLAQICRDKGMPDASTVWDWQQADPDVSQAIARARDLGFDAIAVEALNIADEEPEYTTSEGGSRVDAGEVQHRKLRIETRLKLLAKWAPKKYGDKVTLAGDEENPLRINHEITADADDFTRRIAGLTARQP